MRHLYHRLCSEILVKVMHQEFFRETNSFSILYTLLANKIRFILYNYVHICLALCHEKATYVAFFLEILKKKLYHIIAMYSKSLCKFLALVPCSL